MMCGACRRLVTLGLLINLLLIEPTQCRRWTLLSARDRRTFRLKSLVWILERGADDGVSRHFAGVTSSNAGADIIKDTK